MDKSFKPFFYFVFPTSVLEKAPQTLFAARTVAPGQIGALQNRIVSQFPNVSVIDLSQTISIFIRLMSRLSKIIQLFSLFGVTAGILILVSAVFATRAERVVEVVYYKILGAGRRFVLTVLTLENLLIGLLSTTFALLMAHGAAWWICAFELDIGYRSFLPISMAMAAIFISLVIAVGLAASQSVMAKKPSTYLREQQDG
jgi:putative ABC transport system permease protein